MKINDQRETETKKKFVNTESLGLFFMTEMILDKR